MYRPPFVLYGLYYSRPGCVWLCWDTRRAAEPSDLNWECELNRGKIQGSHVQYLCEHQELHPLYLVGCGSWPPAKKFDRGSRLHRDRLGEKGRLRGEGRQ